VNLSLGYAESKRGTIALPSTIWKIFFFALAIRWIYALTNFSLLGEAGLQGIDSLDYLSFAERFARDIISGNVHGWGWLGPNPFMMPLFTWLLALNFVFAGVLAPLTYVLTQGLIDAGTCVLVHYIARYFNGGIATAAAVAAAVNPTQIVLSAFVFNDTPFTFFVTLFLLASLQWLSTRSASSAVLLGLALGGAALFRILVVPWALILLLFLLTACLISRRLNGRSLIQLVTATILFAICVGSIAWRNIDRYGTWSLTPQSGIHLALWIVPLVKEADDGTPWARSYQRMQDLTAERFGPASTNPFVQSRQFTEIGAEEFAKLSFAAKAKAWLVGAAINLCAPGIILAPLISQLPRTGFYATPGRSHLEKIGNFLFRSDNAVYTWVLLVGTAGVLLIRLIQLVGLAAVAGQSSNLPALLLLAGWILYVLGISGPVASPKYRLPIEPPLTVLTGAGISGLRKKRQRNRNHLH